MEVEVTEPALWLDEAPATTRRLADAIGARLSPDSRSDVPLRFDQMIAMSAAGAGALLGLLIGVCLSVYVAMVDARKRAEGSRSRASYRGSLVVVPALLAGLGALLAAGVAHL